jgi:hypothetical protein
MWSTPRAQRAHDLKPRVVTAADGSTPRLLHGPFAVTLVGAELREPRPPVTLANKCPVLMPAPSTERLELSPPSCPR